MIKKDLEFFIPPVVVVLVLLVIFQFYQIDLGHIARDSDMHHR